MYVESVHIVHSPGCLAPEESPGESCIIQDTEIIYPQVTNETPAQPPCIIYRILKKRFSAAVTDRSIPSVIR